MNDEKEKEVVKREQISHTVRSRDGGMVTIDPYHRTKAIKIHCTECMGWGETNPKDCTSFNCALYPFRGRSLAGYNSDESDGE